MFLTFSLRHVLRATTACTFWTSQLAKMVRTWCVLCILNSKCASCHNGVHFFDISTSKSAPRPRCFAPFHLEMCFAPQRRVIFHLSSVHSPNKFNPIQVLTPHISTLILPWQCPFAQRSSWLRTRRFTEPTFRPSGATHHWKNTVFRDFPTFSRICIFFRLFLFYSSLF